MSDHVPQHAPANDLPPPPVAPVVLVLAGPLTADAAGDLTDALEKAVATADRGASVVLDLAGVTTSDIGTVDALCRLTLAARRLGRRLVVRGASRDLRQLLGLVGLEGVVPCAESSVEAGR